jgi:GxxExxY protein
MEERYLLFLAKTLRRKLMKKKSNTIMTENEISRIVVDACYRIHSKLGPGLFESVYERILVIELEKEGLQVERQKVIPVKWDDVEIEQGFKADIIVENKVIIELKSIDKLADVHYKQLLTYLKLTDLKLGLLINFKENLIKMGIKRIVNNL